MALMAAVAENRRNLRDMQAPLIRDLISAYADILANIQADIDDLSARVQERLDAGLPVSRRWLLRHEQLQRLTQSIEAELLRINREAREQVAGQITRAALQAERDAGNLIDEAMGPRPAGITVSLQQLPAGAIAELVAEIGPGTPLAKLFDRLGPLGAERARETILRGLARGRNAKLIGKDLANAFGLPLARGITIARTEVLRAYRESSRLTYEANRHIVKKWRWVSALDDRTCLSCVVMHGTIHETNEIFGTHPRCFPAGTMVEGPIPEGASVRWYSGPVVEIVTAAGHRLTSTLNHPILTTEGWVAAGLLNEGSYVISTGLSQGPLPSINPDDYQIPARIEDVVRAFASTPGVASRRMPTPTEAFHGDGFGSEVHVVYANGLSKSGFNAAFVEPALQDEFVRRNMQLLPLNSKGAFTFFGSGVGSVPSGTMGRTGIAPVLLGRAFGHHQPVGFSDGANINAGLQQAMTNNRARHSERISQDVLGLSRDVSRGDFVNGYGNSGTVSANLNTSISQHSADDFMRDSKFISELINRNPGFITVDKVIEVRRRPFSGHVHNLQTDGAWYIANRIIVHNCRCAMAPVTASWEELGFEGIPDRRREIQSGIDWFEKQPPQRQLQMMGPAKYEAWNAGEFDLGDLSHYSEHPEWGPTRSEASLKSLLGTKQAEEYYPQAAD